MDSRFCEWCGAILDTSIPFEKRNNVCDQACLIDLKQKQTQKLSRPSKEVGHGSVDLAAFDKSEKMMEIRNILRISANEGNGSTIISFENLGTTREAIYIVTLLRKHGYTVDYGEDVIIVK